MACASEPPPAVPAPAPVEPPPPAVRRVTTTTRIRFGDTFTRAAMSAGLARPEAERVATALVEGCALRPRAGDLLTVSEEDGSAVRAEVRLSPIESCVATERAGALEGERRSLPVETRTVRVSFTIESTLSEALDAAGEDPSLAVALADALAWDVDFYRDPRKGDRVVALVPKRIVRGRTLDYGEVLAASYEGQVAKVTVFRWTPEGRGAGYYDAEGRSAQKAFLRTPLRYARVTSRFGLRRHPVLHRMRAHQGVDYGAPVGTPVWAVADGVVVQAGWNGGLGKSVTLRHANGLTTIYGHLSRVNVRAGARVSQKQVIGAVGSTGMSTGPHLHYAMKRAGRYMNPLALRLPPARPVPAAQKDAYLAAIEPLRSALAGQLALAP